MGAEPMKCHTCEDTERVFVIIKDHPNGGETRPCPACVSNEYDLTDLRSYAELADGLTFSRRKRDDEIRKARKHGHKLEDLADAVGVDQSRISRICKEQE